HLPCKSPDSPGNLLAHAASLKIQPIQWGGDGAYRRDTMERRFIKERQREGIARAKAARTYKGGKPRLDHNLIHKLHIEGLGASAIAKQAGCSRMQVYRVLAKTVAIAT
ncbi:recombinase family protein, partial [Sinorhizobium meliloti]|uniref:helix-turn-helix domain-containing protein n=1 Tax=Rhizobium meliloti TaxID=382 RepID=UPI000FE0A95A